MDVNRTGRLGDAFKPLAETAQGFTTLMEVDDLQAHLERADEALKAALLHAVEAHDRSASIHARAALANKSATRYMGWTAGNGYRLALRRSADAHFRAAGAHTRAAAARRQAALCAQREGNPDLAERHLAAAEADEDAAKTHILAGDSDLQAWNGTDGNPEM